MLLNDFLKSGACSGSLQELFGDGVQFSIISTKHGTLWTESWRPNSEQTAELLSGRRCRKTVLPELVQNGTHMICVVFVMCFERSNVTFLDSFWGPFYFLLLYFLNISRKYIDSRALTHIKKEVQKLMNKVSQDQ